MELNKEKLDKLSIADIFALAQCVDKAEYKQDEQVKQLLEGLKRRVIEDIAELTATTEPFDFEAWLLQNGWTKTDNGTFEKEYRAMDGTDTIELSVSGLPENEFINCSYFSTEFIFGKCKKPSSIQEAETLFKLFNL